MGWVLRLVENGADGQASSLDVMEIGRPDSLRDVVDLGLTLGEAKQILARVQQAVVAAQARGHAAPRPDCPACGGRCHLKDWRSRRVATPFGEVTVRLPRFLCPGCGRREAGVGWPAHCRSTPELDRLQAHLSALMTYRVAAGVLAHLLPVAAGTSHETLRGRTLEAGERLRDAAAIEPDAAAAVAASAIGSIAAKIGCTAETLRQRVRQAERDQGLRTGPTTAEQERIEALEREVRELRQANERLLSNFSAFA